MNGWERRFWERRTPLRLDPKCWEFGGRLRRYAYDDKGVTYPDLMPRRRTISSNGDISLPSFLPQIADVRSPPAGGPRWDGALDQER